MDYFHILGVERTATSEEIKQAYRQKVRLYHPDLNDAPGAVERFREVVQAYEVLSDEKRREQYILSRIRPTPLTREMSPWAQKQRRRHRAGRNSLYLGLLIMGFMMLANVMDRGGQILFFAIAAKPTECRVLGWEAINEGDRYRLHYEAQHVPWQAYPYHASHDFNAPDQDYPPDAYFPCYYNQEWQATQLHRYESKEVLALLPWSFFGLVLLGKSAHYFYKGWN